MCFRKTQLTAGLLRWAFGALALSLNANPLDDSWDNLRRIARDRDYTVQFLDGTCTAGRILGVGPETLNLQVSGERSLVMKRNRVLRIFEENYGVRSEVVYSGRSSWSDVSSVKVRMRESLSVTTLDNKTKTLDHPTVSKDGIASDGQFVAKSDIRSATYVRVTPFTKDELYMIKEDVKILAPRTWFGYSLIPKIRVLLYDATQPEDNSALSCPQGSR